MHLVLQTYLPPEHDHAQADELGVVAMMLVAS